MGSMCVLFFDANGADAHVIFTWTVLRHYGKFITRHFSSKSEAAEVENFWISFLPLPPHPTTNLKDFASLTDGVVVAIMNLKITAEDTS